MSDRRSRGRASWPPSGPRLRWDSYAAALENAQTRQVDRPEEWSARSLIPDPEDEPRTFERPNTIVMQDFVRENLGLRDARATEHENASLRYSNLEEYANEWLSLP